MLPVRQEVLKIRMNCRGPYVAIFLILNFLEQLSVVCFVLFAVNVPMNVAQFDRGFVLVLTSSIPHSSKVSLIAVMHKEVNFGI